MPIASSSPSSDDDDVGDVSFLQVRGIGDLLKHAQDRHAAKVAHEEGGHVHVV